MNNTVTLIMGDPSHDGHNQTETFIVRTNLTQVQIEAAYQQGVQIIGFDLVKDVANRYEESFIEHDDFLKLIDSGFIHELDEWQTQEFADGDGIDVDCELFLGIYFYFVLRGDPNFVYEKIDNGMIEIGGYGLFG